MLAGTVRTGTVGLTRLVNVVQALAAGEGSSASGRCRASSRDIDSVQIYRMVI